jgi:hypothetical protein
LNGSSTLQYHLVPMLRYNEYEEPCDGLNPLRLGDRPYPLCNKLRHRCMDAPLSVRIVCSCCEDGAAVWSQYMPCSCVEFCEVKCKGTVSWCM